MEDQLWKNVNTYDSINSFEDFDLSIGIYSFVVLLFYVHGKHLRSCWDGQLPNHTFPGQA